jgi:cytochrome c-type biogenesis protein
MGGLFTALSDALSANPAIALSAAFVWGVLSMVLSPCHLASIPLIVAYLSGDCSQSTGRAVLVSSSFAVGILASIGIIGGVSADMGRLMGDIGTTGDLLVAAVFILFGLHLMDVLPLPIKGVSLTENRKRGALPALGLGLTVGLALGPCTFAFLAPVLGVVYQMAVAAPYYAVALILFFGIGYSLVIVVAGSSVTLVQHMLRLNEDSGALTWLRRACGVLVVLGGLYLIATA